jgi:hypothetical protein
MEFASDVEIKKISAVVDEFFRCVLDEYEPIFLSDETTIWDVSTSGAAELLERCSPHYRLAISRQDLDQPLWKLLRQLDAGRR